jgi:hypothetical protein
MNRQETNTEHWLAQYAWAGSAGAKVTDARADIRAAVLAAAGTNSITGGPAYAGDTNCIPVDLRVTEDKTMPGGFRGAVTYSNLIPGATDIQTDSVPWRQSTYVTAYGNSIVNAAGDFLSPPEEREYSDQRIDISFLVAPSNLATARLYAGNGTNSGCEGQVCDWHGAAFTCRGATYSGTWRQIKLVKLGLGLAEPDNFGGTSGAAWRARMTLLIRPNQPAPLHCIIGYLPTNSAGFTEYANAVTTGIPANIAYGTDTNGASIGSTTPSGYTIYGFSTVRPNVGFNYLKSVGGSNVREAVKDHQQAGYSAESALDSSGHLVSQPSNSANSSSNMTFLVLPVEYEFDMTNLMKLIPAM